MVCLIPPRGPHRPRPAPSATFSRRFLAAPKSPVTSWIQLLPSRYIRPSWHKAKDASVATVTKTPASFIACFNECSPRLITYFVDSRSSVVVSKHSQPTTNAERPATNDQRPFLNPSPASAPTSYEPATESRRSHLSATTWSAPTAHCCLSSSAPPVARPASEHRSSYR